MATPTISSTTQQFLDIYDITNDLLIMKDGSTSLILTVDAMNFGLLAEEEQDAIMYAYASLLNSLNYNIQIVIRSQTKDATNYLNLLKEQESKASSEEKRNQIRSYREFVGDLIRERNVLDKKFYIVIPATSLEMGLLPPSTVVPGVKQIDISTVERSVILEKAATILEPKRDHLIAQFARIGLYARQLVTQEIIQLFYTSYNPEAAEGQQITQTGDYTTALVSGQTQMTDTNAQPNPQVPPMTDAGVPAAPAAPEPTMPAPEPTMPAPEAPAVPSAPPAPPTDPVAQPPGSPVAPPMTPPSTPEPQAPVPPTAPPAGMPGINTTTIEPMSGTSVAAAPGVQPVSQPAATEPATPPSTPEPASPTPEPSVQEAQNLINVTAQQLGSNPSV